MPLTDIAIRNAKPRDKAYKLADMQGLFLLISPSGAKLWRMKYRFGGVEKKLTFGAYPQVSLRDARKRRDDARDLITAGKDPSIERQREMLRAHALAGNTFTAIAREYCDKRRRDGDRAWAPATAQRCEYLLSLLDNSIGRMAIHEIEPIDALDAIRKIEKRGKLESARRTLQLASCVFRYAVATARLKSDPTRDLRGALTVPKVTHYGAVTEASRVGELLRSIDGYEGQGMTKWSLQLAPHVFVRAGELRHARWDEIDLEARLWTIPAEKMKMRKPHHVPLSILVLSMHAEPLYVTRALNAGAHGYVSKNASPDELLTAIRRVGAGGRYVEQEIAQALALQTSTPASSLAQLAPRELEILRQLAAGKSLSEIADVLGLGYKTIANNCSLIKTKLGVTRTADLLRLALEARLS